MDLAVPLDTTSRSSNVALWPSAAYRSGLRHVLNVATDAELGFAPAGRELAVRRAARPADTLNLQATLVNAADESARFLSMAESTNVGELTVDQMHVDVRRVAHSYLKVAAARLRTASTDRVRL